MRFFKKLTAKSPRTGRRSAAPRAVDESCHAPTIRRTSMMSEVSQVGTGICAAATVRHGQSARCSFEPDAHFTDLGDETLLHNEVSDVVRPVSAEAEALEAMPGDIEELVFLQELPEVLQDVRKDGRGIHLFLYHM